MNITHPMGVLYSCSIKNIFYDKMDLRLFFPCDDIRINISLSLSE